MLDPRPTQVLPPPSTTRWTAWRKRAVVIGVREGAISVNEASDRYNLSREELAHCSEAFNRRGIGGLLSKNRSPTRSTMSPRRCRQHRHPPANLAPEEFI